MEEKSDAVRNTLRLINVVGITICQEITDLHHLANAKVNTPHLSQEMEEGKKSVREAIEELESKLNECWETCQSFSNSSSTLGLGSIC